MEGLKFVETITITFEKMSQDGVTKKTAYFNNALNTVSNIVDLEDDLKIASQEIQTSN